MLVPSEFTWLATCHGTMTTVGDSHEIANVSDKEGVRYRVTNGRKVPFKFFLTLTFFDGIIQKSLWIFPFFYKNHKK